MAGFRWRAGSLLTMLAVLALCVSVQHTPVVSAKDKADSDGTNVATDADGDSSAVPGEKAAKAGKTKAKASAKKKARPESKRKKKGSDDADDSSPGTTPSARPSGSGSFPPVPGNQSNGNSGGTSSKSTPGKSTETAGKSGQTPQTTAGTSSASTSSAKPLSAGTAKGGNGGAGAAAAPVAKVQPPNPAVVQKVIDIQNRNQATLLSQKGIVAVGTGLDEDGNVVIKVCTSGADDPKIPKTIENIPVLEKLTGPIHPLQVVTNPTYQTRVARPVPIGVSAFDDTPKICAAGTLGCRLKDNHGNLYALSNNHVFANENSGKVGVDKIVQPGELDGVAVTLCKFGITNNIVGTLAAFVPIDVSQPNGTNTVDGAIISTNANLVNTSTLRDGYGVPKSTTVKAFLTQHVQKYGRTTGYTSGTVTALNVAFPIGYNPGVANFVNQIEITADDQFLFFAIPGDSGSLVVDFDNNPVALLFAGNGLVTDCNPIDDVLTQLSARLILNRGVPADTVLSIDSSPATPTGKAARSTPDSD